MRGELGREYAERYSQTGKRGREDSSKKQRRARMTNNAIGGSSGRTDVLSTFRKGKMRKRESTTWCAAILQKLENENYRCALTGRTVEPNTAHLDHIQPVAKGGAVSDPANLQILHMDINRAKAP